MNATPVVIEPKLPQFPLQIERAPEKCTIKKLWVAMHGGRQAVGPSAALSCGSETPRIWTIARSSTHALGELVGIQGVTAPPPFEGRQFSVGLFICGSLRARAGCWGNLRTSISADCRQFGLCGLSLRAHSPIRGRRAISQSRAFGFLPSVESIGWAHRKNAVGLLQCLAARCIQPSRSTVAGSCWLQTA